MVFVFSFTKQGSADYITGNVWCSHSTSSNSLTLTAAPHSDPLCKYNMRVYITRNWHKKSTGHYYYGIIPCCLFLCEPIRLLWFARLALWTFLWSRLIRTCFSCACPLERPAIDSNYTKSVKTHSWNLLCIKQKKYVNISTPHKELGGYCSSCIQQQTAGILKLKFWNWKNFTFFMEKLGMYGTYFLQNKIMKSNY